MKKYWNYKNLYLATSSAIICYISSCFMVFNPNIQTPLKIVLEVRTAHALSIKNRMPSSLRPYRGKQNSLSSREVFSSENQEEIEQNQAYFEEELAQREKNVSYDSISAYSTSESTNNREYASLVKKSRQQTNSTQAMQDSTRQARAAGRAAKSADLSAETRRNRHYQEVYRSTYRARYYKSDTEEDAVDDLRKTASEGEDSAEAYADRKIQQARQQAKNAEDKAKTSEMISMIALIIMIIALILLACVYTAAIGAQMKMVAYAMLAIALVLMLISMFMTNQSKDSTGEASAAYEGALDSAGNQEYIDYRLQGRDEDADSYRNSNKNYLQRSSYGRHSPHNKIDIYNKRQSQKQEIRRKSLKQKNIIQNR